MNGDSRTTSTSTPLHVALHLVIYTWRQWVKSLYSKWKECNPGIYELIQLSPTTTDNLTAIYTNIQISYIIYKVNIS